MLNTGVNGISKGIMGGQHHSIANTVLRTMDRNIKKSRRNSGIVRIQGNHRIEGFHNHLTGEVGILKADSSNGKCSVERNVAKMGKSAERGFIGAKTIAFKIHAGIFTG